MYKVSVIISTYNRNQFLVKTLTSLRRQTFKDFEVLVCDDGGDTNTKDAIYGFGKYYPLRYFWRENKNEYGLAATRNMGAKEAGGKYLFFLDSDMILLPETIEKMYKWLTKFPWRGKKFHTVPEKRIHVENKVTEDVILNHFDKIKNYAIKGFSKKYEGISPGGGGMISQEIFEKIGGFDDILFTGLVKEDIEFIYRLEAFLGNRTKRLPFIMYHLDNRGIRSDREIKSRRNESLASSMINKKFQLMGFKFEGKRPQKDFENFNNKHYEKFLANKKLMEEISIKLRKEVEDFYDQNTDIKNLEKEYIQNKDTRRPLVYIIILNFNGLNWLKKCIPSVLKTKYPNFKILVVDNGSNDGSIEFLKENYPQVEIKPLEKNFGYAEGNNKGIRHALRNGAEYIAVLNNDAKVDSDWLEKLVFVSEKHFDAGAVGPLILDGEGKKVQGPMAGFNRPSYLSLKQFEGKKEKIAEKIVGCAILFKRKALEKAGLFDKTYFCYQEEFDWCQRARFHGFNLYHVPQSKIYHFGFKTSARRKDLRYLKMYLLYNSNEIRRFLKDPNKSLNKLLKYVAIKHYHKIPQKNKNFFIYYICLFYNLLMIPQIIYKRKIEKRGSCYL